MQVSMDGLRMEQVRSANALKEYVDDEILDGLTGIEKVKMILMIYLSSALNTTKINYLKVGNTYGFTLRRIAIFN